MKMVGKIIQIAVITLLSGSLAQAATSKENYNYYCAQCHGLEGKGDGPNATESQPVSPKDHTDAKEMSELTKDDVIKVIRGGGAATGKSTMMPPFGKTITEAEIQDLVNYLRKLCNCKFENEP